MGTVLNSARPYDIVRLLDRRVVLELDALTNADKTFLIESLLLWIHHYRLAQPQREDFKHAIVIEEAHHILLRKKQETTGEESVTDVLLREIRELGEAIICLDQHPSLISKPALGNTYATFAFNLKHRGDIAMMQDCLHLDGEQAGYLGRLEAGWAMVKLQGRWFLPFLVKLPLVSLAKGSTRDEDIRRRHGRMAREADSRVISLPEGDSVPQETADSREDGIPRGAKNEEMGDGCAIRLTTQERQFLADIWRHPTSSVTRRYSSLGLSSRGGTGVQKSLQARGLIASHSISTGRARVKVLSLTALGRALLGVSEPDGDRLGGPEHRYWKRRLAERLAASGYGVTEEAPLGGGKTC